MQDAVDQIKAAFKKPADDPDFYAAKKMARDLLPEAQMVELHGRTMTVVVEGEAHKFKLLCS